MFSDGHLTLLPLRMFLRAIGRGCIHHRMSQPSFHKEVTIFLPGTQIATEDSYCFLVTPRQMVINEQKVAVLIQLQYNRVIIVLYNRPVFHNSRFWSHVWLVATIQNPA